MVEVSKRISLIGGQRGRIQNRNRNNTGEEGATEEGGGRADETDGRGQEDDSHQTVQGGAHRVPARR